MLAAVDELVEFDFIRPTEAPRRFRFRHPIVRRAVYDGDPAAAGGSGPTPERRRRSRQPTLPPRRAPTTSRAPRSAGDERGDRAARAGRLATPRPRAGDRRAVAAGGHPAAAGAERRRRAAAVAARRGGRRADLRRRLRRGARRARRAPAACCRPSASRSGPRLVARIAFARRMSGRPLESRGAGGAAPSQSLAPDSRGALGLTLELALDHYWRGRVRPDARGRRARSWNRARERDERAVRDLGGRRCAAWPAASENRLAVRLARSSGEAEAICDALSDERARRADRRARLPGPGVIRCSSAPTTRSQYAREGLRAGQSTGQSPFIPGLLVLETNALVMKGRITEAAAVAETATDAAVLTGNDQFAVWALWADAMACSAAGDTARALASAREAAARPSAWPRRSSRACRGSTSRPP